SGTPLPSSSLEISGTPGVKVFGTCISSDGTKTTHFEGTIPTKVELEIGVQKCSFSSSSKKGKINVRLSHSQEVVINKEIDVPTAGVEISIPLGK
ncbi:MAG: hypothetical protein JWQ35_196, partial [Bacteriovoracaceae bacterium]|nr:hypothetical protein [Bacteriovoracaceae bacterium]